MSSPAFSHTSIPPNPPLQIALQHAHIPPPISLRASWTAGRLPLSAALVARPLLCPSRIDYAPSLARCVWVLAAHDVDRGVAGVAAAARVGCCTLTPKYSRLQQADAANVDMSTIKLKAEDLYTPLHFSDPLVALLNVVHERRAGAGTGMLTPTPNPYNPNPAANTARTPSPMPLRLPSPARDGTLTAPLPTQAALTAALSAIAIDRTPTLAASRLTLAAIPLILVAVPLIPPSPSPSPSPPSPYLLKQLGMQEDVARALGLLHQAACRASLLCPQPAYVFDLILLGDFGASGPTSTPLPIPPALLLLLIPAGETRTSRRSETHSLWAAASLPCGARRGAHARVIGALYCYDLKFHCYHGFLKLYPRYLNNNNATTRSSNALPPALLLTLAHALLPAAWAEPDVQTRGTCGGAILTPLHTLFDALWGALAASTPADANVHDTKQQTRTQKPNPRPRADNRAPRRARAAFVGAVLEAGGTGEWKGIGAREGIGEAGARLFTQEVARVADAAEDDERETDAKKEAKEANAKPLLHVDARRAAVLVRGVLGAAGGVGGDLLTTLSACLRAGSPPALVCAVLEALVGVEDEAATPEVESDPETPTAKLPPALVGARIRAAGLALWTEVLQGAVRRADAVLLVHVLAAFSRGEGVWGGEVAESLNVLLAARTYALLLTAPALLLSYLRAKVGENGENNHDEGGRI
ncbi:hypothetical protein C8F04DRAFT_1265238 [Mycena alexandri]|uniref:Uncharacterized protein n=1 Tax=Mycena alexandri TaxID=1745969 RepID=A0AAD6SJJ4_9AGAR|nr:hypothetical protein C8F04DRAFT_1265238 [Mycena alexandri]